MRITLSLILLYFCNSLNYCQSGESILDSMFQTIHSIHSIEFTLSSIERFGEAYRKDEGYIQVKYSPYCVYYKQIIPDQGVEFFYTEGENEGKAILKLNKFPFLTMNLYPFQMQMRKNRHHTIFETGVMKYMADATINIMEKNRNSVEIKYLGLFKINNILCYKIVLNNPEYKLLNYIIDDNENLIDISKRYKICDYLVVDINDNIKKPEDIVPGKEIFLPSEYAKTI